MILPKKAIINAHGYDQPQYRENFLLKLDLNENMIGPSAKTIEAIQNISQEDIKFYPVYGELINRIAEFNNVDKSMVLLTNGADEAISYIFNTFIDPDDAVLTVTPTFAMPKIYAKSTGCTYKEVKYQEKWIFPVDEFIKNIDEKTRLIIITTPNSPTGEAISRENLLKIINSAQSSLILIDETYSTYAEEKFTDLACSYNNVISIKSMSKDFALAGLRLGYIISDRQNIEYIKRIISPFSVNSVAVKAGIASIEDREHIESVKNQVRESKELLTEGFKPMAKAIYPSEANFLLVDFEEKADFFYKKLLNSGIKVKNFPENQELKNCFRMAVPAPNQVKLILDALKPRDLLIFDIDGVLVDTRNSYRMAIKETYRHFSGKEISFEVIQQAKNLGGLNNDWDLTEYLLKNSGINTPKELIIDKFQELYYGNDGTGYILNENLLVEPDILRNLAKNYDMAIFTGRPKIEAEFMLKRWNLQNLFSVIVTMDDIPSDFQKPDPYGIKHILSIASPKSACYFGDTPDDMIAAAKAGVKAIGVLPPQDKSETLRKKLLLEGAEQILEKTCAIISCINV